MDDLDDYMPYRPSEKLEFIGRVNGSEHLVSDDEPLHPEPNMVWTNPKTGEVKVHDGEKWNGQQLNLDSIETTIDALRLKIEQLEQDQPDLSPIDESLELLKTQIEQLSLQIPRITLNGFFINTHYTENVVLPFTNEITSHTFEYPYISPPAVNVQLIGSTEQSFTFVDYVQDALGLYTGVILHNAEGMAKDFCIHASGIVQGVDTYEEL
ncbi:hypothetical protein ACI2JA_19815 [Alkalihalobacillus sp. NPDC078783]|uniref:hypothetical protein n=1 Tax=Streptomyces albidoflavus TaxID=1886 RepID=UPI0033D2AA83